MIGLLCLWHEVLHSIFPLLAQPYALFMLMIDFVLLFFLLVEAWPGLERFLKLKSLQPAASRSYHGPIELMNFRFLVWQLFPVLLYSLFSGRASISRAVHFEPEAFTGSRPSISRFLVETTALV